MVQRKPAEEVRSLMKKNGVSLWDLMALQIVNEIEDEERDYEGEGVANFPEDCLNRLSKETDNPHLDYAWEMAFSDIKDVSEEMGWWIPSGND